MVSTRQSAWPCDGFSARLEAVRCTPSFEPSGRSDAATFLPPDILVARVAASPAAPFHRLAIRAEGSFLAAPCLGQGFARDLESRASPGERIVRCLRLLVLLNHDRMTT